MRPTPIESAAAAASPVPDGRALRFLTAGSVDDGKSTLIGRLLFDSQAILADQLDSLTRRAAGAPLDLSLLTDGLEAEREQGITIDVAHRYFSTPRRKFVIADAPGHEQYTRNMVTAASGSDAAVVLVDITKLDLGARPLALLPQTRRHTLLAHLLRVPSIVFAVNKLDAVADPAAAYGAVREALLEFAARAGVEVAAVVPVSALRGDNVATPLDAPWYGGPSLLQLLETLPAAQEPAAAFALPVQHVTRPDGSSGGAQSPAAHDGRDARTIWGRLASGRVAPGDVVQVFPGVECGVVVEVRVAGSEVDFAVAGQSAGIVLHRPLDISRGDWLAAPGTLQAIHRFHATLAWLDTDAACVGRRYRLRHGNRWVHARIAAIESRLDVRTLAETAADELGANEIGRVEVQLQEPLPLAPYRQSRIGGALIVVDPASHRTSGALLVAD